MTSAQRNVFRVFVSVTTMLTVAVGPTLAHGAAVDPWRDVGSMSVARAYHTATLLLNGRVLVAGGLSSFDDSGFGVVTGTTEMYEPATNTWRTSAPMLYPRTFHSAVLLNSGRVLVVGGIDGDRNPVPPEILFALDGSVGAGSPHHPPALEGDSDASVQWEGVRLRGRRSMWHTGDLHALDEHVGGSGEHRPLWRCTVFGADRCAASERASLDPRRVRQSGRRIHAVIRVPADHEHLVIPDRRKPIRAYQPCDDVAIQWASSIGRGNVSLVPGWRQGSVALQFAD